MSENEKDIRVIEKAIKLEEGNLKKDKKERELIEYVKYIIEKSDSSSPKNSSGGFDNEV